MPTNRPQYKLLEAHYKWLHQGTKCYYCSDRAETKDHVPPISVVYAFGRDYMDRRGVKLLKVRACRQCNSILSDLPYWTVNARARYIYKVLTSKYHRILNSPEWEEAELAEVGPVLRSYLIQNRDIRGWLERRLQFMEDLFYDVI